VSFRKKNKGKNKEAEEDVKVSHAKDSQGAAKKSAQEQSSEQQSAQQTTGQQSGQESGQPTEQESEESSEEQKTDEEEDEDKSDDSEPVPDGTTAEILRWVGDDKARAQRALDKEQQDDRPRAGLTGELRKVLGA
jgi:hypothetical protein